MVIAASGGSVKGNGFSLPSGFLATTQGPGASLTGSLGVHLQDPVDGLALRIKRPAPRPFPMVDAVTEAWRSQQTFLSISMDLATTSSLTGQRASQIVCVWPITVRRELARCGARHQNPLVGSSWLGDILPIAGTFHIFGALGSWELQKCWGE